MIPLPSGTKIWLVAGITDMRNGFNGLAAKVQTALTAGAAGDAAGRYRLATAQAVADLPDHAVNLFILVVTE